MENTPSVIPDRFGRRAGFGLPHAVCSTKRGQGAASAGLSSMMRLHVAGCAASKPGNEEQGSDDPLRAGIFECIRTREPNPAAECPGERSSDKPILRKGRVCRQIVWVPSWHGNANPKRWAASPACIFASPEQREAVTTFIVEAVTANL